MTSEREKPPSRGLDEDEVYEAHWAGDGDGKVIAKVMCRGKKQACGKYPSPRNLIPEDKWARDGGMQLPEAGSSNGFFSHDYVHS